MTKPNQPLHPIEASHLHARRERVFLLIAALFLGSLTMLNILGVSRFMTLFSIATAEDGSWSVNWWQAGVANSEIVFALAVGVLPYPLTFLCTDLISEFYGRKRANWLVVCGLILNFWVVLILWVGGTMPQKPTIDPDTELPQINIVDKPQEEKELELDIDLGEFGMEEEEEETDAEEKLEEVRKNYTVEVPYDYAFYQVRALAFGAVFASMLAYLLAQFCDVYLFHFWKRLTRGKHLWLRNNGSTLVSQLLDTVTVIVITHFLSKQLPGTEGLEGGDLWQVLFLTFILPGYFFKVIVALLDTIPFYMLVAFLKKYLQFDPVAEEQPKESSS